jgi:hypothetical protein
MSKNQVLKIAAAHGQPAPNYLCFSNSILPTTISWKLQDVTYLPSGITEHHGAGGKKWSSNLEWNRAMKVTDSGKYQCTASNKKGNNTGWLDLLVRREY